METKGQPEAQNEAVRGSAQVSESPECPVTEDKDLVPAHDACRTLGEDKCPIGHSSGPELQKDGIKLGKGLNPEVEAAKERDSRTMASIVRPSHGPKRKPIKAEAELPPRMLQQKEEPEGSHSESSPSAKQHKKTKKRKSLGPPVLPAAVTVASSETLGLDSLVLPRVFAGKAQRLRPLYQYINYCNPELNQAGEGDREVEAEPQSELALVPEEAGVEQLQPQALLPVAGEVGLGLAAPCTNGLVPLTHALAPRLGGEAGEEPVCSSSLKVSGNLKIEMDKSTQVDIDKMLSVCTAPLVPPLSPQYK
uniref:RIKEN cDNA 4933405L10 gene n=1 Tax=Jaculus jaculus TaxID=51337 RepID=A0A8C5KW77_JACJA|nr:uncharacterized protein C16orf86 homolog [Jaculus jaculus]